MAKAFFIDIDYTLISKGAGPFADDLAAIYEARAAGHKFFLATGRSMGSIMRGLREADWVDGFITGCGASVFLDGKNIHRAFVPPALLAPIARYYLESGKWCVFEGEKSTACVHRCPMFDYGIKTLQVEDEHFFESAAWDDVVTKVTMEGALSEKEKALFESGLRIIQFKDYSEAIVEGEDKARGIERILGALSISREDSVAIGDSENDIGMLKAAGTGVAMGNACEELKKCADFVTKNVGEGGVAEAIKRITKI